MTRLIRRRSMERLELYDLDKFTRNYQTPPPLPPPRKQRRRPSANATLERYQFLCNMTRSKTDPIYAATPMFTTIPQSSKGKHHHHRQILGSYVRFENIKPVPEKSPESDDGKTEEKHEDHGTDRKIEEKQEGDGGDVQDEDDKENDDSDDQFSSSSSSDENEENYDDNDDDNKGVVEQLLNRNKKN